MNTNHTAELPIYFNQPVRRAVVLRRGEASKEVKNLGWLLRNWQSVESLGFNYAPKGMNDGQLAARLKDGSVYMTDFACLTVCWRWLNRPVFQSVPFTLWNSTVDPVTKQQFTVGDVNWCVLQEIGDEGSQGAYAEFFRSLNLSRPV